MLFNLLKQFFNSLLEKKPKNIYKYEPVDVIRGKMLPEEVLKLIAPIVTDANNFLKPDESLIAPSSPILEENQERNHHLWSVVLLYQQFKGNLIDVDEPKVYLYLVVNDETKEINEIYPR